MTTIEPCAGATYGEHERRMLDWHGLRPSRARVCLRVVLGKRCVAYNGRRGNPYDLNYDCLCLTVQQPHRWAFDHVRIWLDQAGRYVLTTEPYNHTPQRIEEFIAEMAELGITVTVGDRSPWYPGSTTLLLLKAQR